MDTDSYGYESFVIKQLTGKSLDEVMGAYSVPELLHLSGFVIFMNSL